MLFSQELQQELDDIRFGQTATMSTILMVSGMKINSHPGIAHALRYVILT